MVYLTPIAYFTARGVRFEYSAENPYIPQVYGPSNDKELFAKLNAAVEERRGLPRRVVPRSATGECLFCNETGLPNGMADCHLCRLIAVRIMREGQHPPDEPF